MAVLLLAANPFCYAFSRLAILEPMLVLLTLLALLVASGVRPIEGQGWARLRSALPVLALGALIPLMVLTKTTAAFLLPAVGWMLWAAAGYRLRPFLRVSAPVGALAAVLWGAYFGLVVRPHFLEDYRYLFSANAYTGMTRENALSVLTQTVQDGVWMGKLIYALWVLAALGVLGAFRRYMRDPLVPALLLWTLGYLGFLAYHNNLQPRYYLVIAVPMTLLVPVLLEDLDRRRPPHHRGRGELAAGGVACAGRIGAGGDRRDRRAADPALRADAAVHLHCAPPSRCARSSPPTAPIARWCCRSAALICR